MSSVRILPVLTLVLSVVLGLKAFEIWTGFDAVSSARAAAASKDDHAEDHATDHGAGKGKDDHHDDHKSDASHKDGHDDGHGGDHETSKAHGEKTEAAAQTPILRHRIPGEEGGVSAAEMEVLQSLAQRREALSTREAELDMRENLLAATEKRIDEKIAELKALEAEIKTALNTLDQEEEEQIKSLVKVYETMKPKSAAPILQNLDREILIQVVSRMKEAKMAAILSKMDPVAAQELTVMLATHGERPDRVLPVSGG